jgi:hypothetical protein
MSIRDQFDMEKMEEFVTKEDFMKTKIEFVHRLITIVIAGLGLMAVLAWDEALKHLFSIIFKKEGTLGADIGYAVVITIFGTIVSIYLRKIFIKKHE